MISTSQIISNKYKKYKFNQTEIFTTTAVLIILTSVLITCTCRAKLNLLTLPRKECWRCKFSWS